MGRDKGHQRVKGNVKPASSGRSAELTTSAPTGQITFGSLSSGTVPPFVPIIPEPDETGLDNQIALILRKLGKKDATTKIKAVSELSDACKNDESIPSTILPYWPKIYVRLAVDDSKKVRELAHCLLETIATSVGRNLAPYTKALIPTLFLSQSDTFAPASSAARTAFTSIFPTEEKQKQAIIFCLAEFSSVLTERLNEGTELSKISFLDGLNRLLRLKTGSELLEWFDSVLKQQVFWTMAADEYALVRKTFFDVLSTLAETAGNRIPKSKLSAALRQGFETERLELQSLWNCFLTLAINGVFEEKSIAETQIVICAKNAFYGHATQLGPLLLPLVAKLGLPPQIFEALEEGFHLEKSLIERQAIVRTYAELVSFFYREKETVAQSVFPFVTSQLESMSEFGRTISTLVKKESFYKLLAQSCLENQVVLRNPHFGTFLISFFKDRATVKFSDTLEVKSVYDSIVQKDFLGQLSQGILQIKNFSSFSTLMRWLSGSSYLPDLIAPDEIPNKFDFSEEDDKLVRLRLSLEVMKAFPDSPHSLTLLSTVFHLFKDSTEDLEVFVREVEPFDNLKELRKWLKSGIFNDDLFLKSNFLTKYMLRRKEIFGEEMIRTKLELLEESPEDHLDLARDFINDPSNLKTVDLTGFFVAIWNAFLEDKTGEVPGLVEIAERIVEKNMISRRTLLERASDKAGNVETLKDLNRLVAINFELLGDEEVSVENFSVPIDSDLLVFRGFGMSSLKSSDFEVPPEFSASKVLRQVIFNTEVVRGRENNENNTASDLVQLESIALNLLYATVLVDITKDTNRRNWLEPVGAAETEIYEKVNSLTSNMIEALATLSTWKGFWKNVCEKSSDTIWDSKFPVMKLIEITNKLEIPLPKYDTNVTDLLLLQEIPVLNFKTIKELGQIIRLNPNPPYTKVIEVLTTRRNQNPEVFHFEEQFNILETEEKHKLLGILDIVIELIGKDVEFASVASCWVSAWLKQQKDMYDSDKTSYLWTSKLSRAVVLLAKFSSVETPFSVEFTEFHAANLFPPVYMHFLQLASSEEFWAVEAIENVAEAIALIPSTILNSLLEEPSKAFEIFLPLTLREGLVYKVVGHALLSKVTLTKEILPREFEAFSKRFRKGGTKSDEAKVTFLLLWDALLRAQPNAFELANYVKEDHLLPQALNLLFFDLLESSVVPTLKTYFDTNPIITCRSISCITHLGAWVLQNLLRTLPYTVRWWWASLRNKGDKAHVEKITTKLLSAKLAAEELNKFKWDEAGDNVSVNSHPGCNELIARYKIEETSVTLKITLPLNHPLGPVTVSVSDKRLHARISQLLNTRSHSLTAGLRLWKESLDGVYRDAEECAICFFILQHQTKQLPKMGCKTCKKKFHATCLYKWFSTSNKSECPLCRNLW